jgi:cysteine desulfurase/selenocysteine lyase
MHFRLRIGVVLVLIALQCSAPVACAQALPGIASPAAGGTISAIEAYQAAKSGRTLFVDTREAYEKRSGSPAGVGAEITYLMGGSGDSGFVRAMLKLVDGRRDADITLICQAGVRSAAAERVLESNGFTKVRSVAGGYESWREQQLPSKPLK